MRRRASAGPGRMRRWFVASGRSDTRKPGVYNIPSPLPDLRKLGVYSIILGTYERFSLPWLGILTNVPHVGVEDIRQRGKTDDSVHRWGDV